MLDSSLRKGPDMLARALVLALAAGVVACSDSPTPTIPPTPTPTPAPTGTFGVVSASPGFGGLVSEPESDEQGTSSLTVTFQVTYTGAIPSPYFVVVLLNGPTECLRTQVAYCTLTGGGGTPSSFGTATYRCPFFVRDSQQPSCGAHFTTDRVRLVLQDRDTLRTVFTQEVSGGWTFSFAR